MDVGSDPQPKTRVRPEQSGAILTVADGPKSTRAWGDGVRGEELLNQVLADLTGVVAFHDRRMPRTRSIVDHIVIAPGGVFVVDAKRYAGRIGIHNKGSLFRSDHRLFVGRRDCSGLAEKVAWQARVLREALQASGGPALPPITPVLCFVDGDWPLINPPGSFGGVRLESDRSLKRLVTHGPAADLKAIEWAIRTLSAAGPAK